MLIRRSSHCQGRLGKYCFSSLSAFYGNIAVGRIPMVMATPDQMTLRVIVHFIAIIETPHHVGYCETFGVFYLLSGSEPDISLSSQLMSDRGQQIMECVFRPSALRLIAQ